MKILIASDKFKGCLDAQTVCESIALGLKTHVKISPTIIPLADGGDGTLKVLQSSFGFAIIKTDTVDALGRKINSTYISNGKQAFIELAEASGIARLKSSEYNILSTSTIGTGYLIKHAIENNHNEIILTVGGSCSNDLGFGIAHALGYSFLDSKKNKLIPNGGNLLDIIEILPPIIPIDISIKILCDVDNVLLGLAGAAYTFGLQKGGDAKTIQLLDESMKYVSQLIHKKFGKDIANFKGAGAGGGIPAGLFGLFKNISIESGFDFISKSVSLEDKIKQSDLVITGEGQFDKQSLQGKVVGKVISICQENNTPVIIVTGQSKISQQDLKSLKIKKIYEVINLANDKNDSLENCSKYLTGIGKRMSTVF